MGAVGALQVYAAAHDQGRTAAARHVLHGLRMIDAGDQALRHPSSRARDRPPVPEASTRHARLPSTSRTHR